MARPTIAETKATADGGACGQPSAPNFEIFQPINVGEPPERPNVLPENAPQDGVQLALHQASPTTEVGDPHDAVVTATDESGTALPGRRIAYTVTGANPTSGAVTTGADGRTVISWTGSATGIDELIAWDDPDSDAAHDADEAATGVEVTWTERIAVPTTSTLTSSQNPSKAGKPVTLTATIAASDGGATPTGWVRFTDELCTELIERAVASRS